MPTAENLKPLMTYDELCAIAGISKGQLHRLFRMNEGPTVTNLGLRCPRVTEEHAREWIASRVQK
jgi:hypothetical protein